MKHKNRVIANRPYRAYVKPKQFGLLDIMALLLPIRKYRRLDAFFTISPMRHVHIPIKKVGGTCSSPLLIASNSSANFS